MRLGVPRCWLLVEEGFCEQRAPAAYVGVDHTEAAGHFAALSEVIDRQLALPTFQPHAPAGLQKGVVGGDVGGTGVERDRLDRLQRPSTVAAIEHRPREMGGDEGEREQQAVLASQLKGRERIGFGIGEGTHAQRREGAVR